jgi:hypothetical protein
VTARRISGRGLEWNRNVRVIGFFGAEELVRKAFGELPRLKKTDK